jgi:hypothetical protein
MFLKENDMSVYTSAWQDFVIWLSEYAEFDDDDMYTEAVNVFDKYENEAIELRNKLHEAEMLVIDLREELANVVEPIIRSQQYNDEVYKDTL